MSALFKLPGYARYVSRKHLIDVVVEMGRLWRVDVSESDVNEFVWIVHLYTARAAHEIPFKGQEDALAFAAFVLDETAPATQVDDTFKHHFIEVMQADGCPGWISHRGLQGVTVAINPGGGAVVRLTNIDGAFTCDFGTAEEAQSFALICLEGLS